MYSAEINLFKSSTRGRGCAPCTHTGQRYHCNVKRALARTQTRNIQQNSLKNLKLIFFTHVSPFCHFFFILLLFSNTHSRCWCIDKHMHVCLSPVMFVCGCSFYFSYIFKLTKYAFNLIACVFVFVCIRPIFVDFSCVKSFGIGRRICYIHSYISMKLTMCKLEKSDVVLEKCAWRQKQQRWNDARIHFRI